MLSFLLVLTTFALYLDLVSASSDVTVITTASTVTVTGSTVTTYVASPTSTSSQYTDDLTLRTSVLNSTNFFRFQHNASYIPWNDSLAGYAQNYSSQCIWAHSYGSQGYGENLARGYPDITSAVDAWGNERDLYDFSGSQSGFSEATGHFTQLVWKDTQSGGCGVFDGDGKNGVGGWMLVCEYWPPGNVEGTGSDKNRWFGANVQAQIHQGDGGFNEMSATMGATGVAGWATGTGSGIAVTGTSGGQRVGVGSGLA